MRKAMGNLHVATLLSFNFWLLIVQFQLCHTQKIYSNTSCIERERKALLKFRESLIDESHHLSSWCGENCCSWEGIGCSKSNGHVVKLDLHNQFPFDPSRYFYDVIYANSYSTTCLGGEISPSLLELEHLQYLDLSMNNFSGIPIPTFLGSLRNLRYLDLSSAGFEGMVPDDLGNLSRLKYLHLGDTPQGWSFGSDFTLTAKDLWWIAKLSSLESLDLSGVQIVNKGDWLHAVNMLPSLLSLTLAGCDLKTIPPVSHINFTSLTSLDLKGNGFSSPIPLWFSNMTSLMNLHLEGNYFFGPIPDSLLQLTSLTLLHLSSNSFRTSLPDSLCNLSSLAYVDLSFNHFQGSLPVCLGKLSSLTILHVHSNEFSGTIPTSLGQLTKLQRLRLADNPFTGMLSDFHFANLRELKILDISSTLLSWNVSSMWIPPFQLQYIHMGSTKLGPPFPSWLQTQREVNTLIMSNASISDTIPDWFEKVYSQIHYLDLSTNNITGKPPVFKEINTFDRLIIFYSNKFEGSLVSFPPNAVAFDASRNLLTGNIPPLDGNSEIPLILRYLHLNDNQLTGSIPDCICNIQSLFTLDLSNNQLTGRVPLCLGKLQQLKTLNLRNNSLSGHIPNSLGYMEPLVYLLLSKNKFHGELPWKMQNMKNLQVLDLGENGLSGILPAWICNGLSNLRILRLQSNNLEGNISMQFCHLKDLQVLNLAHNKLEGKIPTCFGNLSAMVSTESDITPFAFYLTRHPQKLSNFMKGRELEYSTNLPYLRSLELSGNNLVGEVPEELMDLVGLQSLTLSNNHLSGRIPDKIGNLKQLESLDLSRNELSGSIPLSLSTIDTLSYLNLSFNNLSGRIPTGNQLQTLNDPSSFEGNSGLCGKPLLKTCPDDKSPDGNKSSGRHEAGEESYFSWFFAGIGPGFAVGFSAVCGILTFKKSWRYAYFQFMENVYNRLWLAIALKTSKLQRKFSRCI
ncbi:receptor-like protein EIX1 [Coffea arabica]|uniref:Receptor-like protein EIX1 n=1 Tax=Coffea arabica TaxID=13443 RepID=A0A6P6VB67_COFAR|nr:receptor-like protein EIX1 [Coffea arabica]